MTDLPDRATFARELAATLTEEVNSDAVQEFLEAKGIDYDHDDVAEIEYLVEGMQLRGATSNEVAHDTGSDR